MGTRGTTSIEDAVREFGSRQASMSDTKKDEPVHIRFPLENITKKPKVKDTTWHWLHATPSWWTRLFMNRPQRRKGKLWEATAKHEQDPEQLDAPGVSKKPHKYYW